MTHQTLAMFGLPGGVEWVVIGVFGLLVFGRRLPEIARSMGKSIVEFKKGMRDVKSEFDVSDEPDRKILPKSSHPTDVESTLDSPPSADVPKNVD